MPFEISPKFVEAPAKVGEFQDVADAILRGCAATKPLSGDFYGMADGCLSACVQGAAIIGFVGAPVSRHQLPDEIHARFCDAFRAYRRCYGVDSYRQNDSGELTREQIAERIAAL